LGVELANWESISSWKDFLLGLKQRGLNGVELVVSDDHPGPHAAIREVLPEAAWQRCYVHFLRNALDRLSRKADDESMTEPQVDLRSPDHRRGAAGVGCAAEEMG
jgi:putative transposase